MLTRLAVVSTVTWVVGVVCCNITAGQKRSTSLEQGVDVLLLGLSQSLDSGAGFLRDWSSVRGVAGKPKHNSVKMLAEWYPRAGSL